MSTSSKTTKKLTSLKDAILQMAAEDPLIAAFFLCTILPLTSEMFSAIRDGNETKVFLIIAAYAGLVLVIFIPLMGFKSVRAYFYKTANQDKIMHEAEKELMLEREQHKQHRMNQWFDAKIKNIQAQTAYITESTKTFETYLITSVAEQLQKGLTDSLSVIGGEKKLEAQKVMMTLMEKLKENNTNYDTLMKQINKMELTLNSDERKVLNLDQNLIEDPIEDLEATMKTITPPLPTTTWTCSCGFLNNKRSIKCKKCKKSKT